MLQIINNNFENMLYKLYFAIMYWMFFDIIWTFRVSCRYF